MTERTQYDVVVLGSGPSGQKAAIQAAKGGASVAIVERERGLGGECVHRGTIPSKTLRESAVQLARLRQRAAAFEFHLRDDITVSELLGYCESVIANYDETIQAQVARNGITHLHGRAAFDSPWELTISHTGGRKTLLEAGHVIIATGSVPRCPDNVPVDHEHIFDSDSILSMPYLPESMIVLGSGVIACEYASIFAILGVKVTIVDKWQQPLGFLDPELTDVFVESFEACGGTFLPGSEVDQVAFDGAAGVDVLLKGGTTLNAAKVFCALGRIASLKGLRLERAGLTVNDRGLLDADDNCQTEVPHIYAVGDVIGPPSLAATAMEQGRRAACHLLGLDAPPDSSLIPAGIYAIPEMSSVGQTESEVRESGSEPVVGRARFDEIARGQIAGAGNGLMKLVADAEGRKLLGVHIVGDGATELVHIGQMALINDMDVDAFVTHIFNFPTMAEAYRIAALDIIGQRTRRTDSTRSSAA